MTLRNFRMTRKRAYMLAGILAILAVIPAACNLAIARSMDRRVRAYGPPGTVYPPFAPVASEGRAPAVLFLHGFGGSPRDFAPLTDELRREGIAFEAVLLPGHGVSPRELGNVSAEELMTAAREARDRLILEHGGVIIAGFSMGGALALNLAAEPGVEGVLLYGPYIRVTPHWYYMGRVEGWARYLHHVLPYVPKLCSGNINDPEGRKRYKGFSHLPVKTVTELDRLGRDARAASSRITCPVLWMHSPGDIAADCGAAREVFDLLGSQSKEFVEYPRSNHIVLYDYDASDAIKRSLSFIRTRGEEHNSHFAFPNS